MCLGVCEVDLNVKGENLQGSSTHSLNGKIWFALLQYVHVFINSQLCNCASS